MLLLAYSINQISAGVDFLCSQAALAHSERDLELEDDEQD
jgi:hypothetical protein